MMDTSHNAFLPSRRTTYWEHESLGLLMWTMTVSFQQDAGQGIEGILLRYITIAITNPILNLK